MNGHPRLPIGPTLPRERRVEPTSRELDVIALVVAGRRNKEIAFELQLSEQTVKNHMTRIFEKLDVRDRVSLVLHAIQNGWVAIGAGGSRERERAA